MNSDKIHSITFPSYFFGTYNNDQLKTSNNSKSFHLQIHFFLNLSVMLHTWMISFLLRVKNRVKKRKMIKIIFKLSFSLIHFPLKNNFLKISGLL